MNNWYTEYPVLDTNFNANVNLYWTTVHGIASSIERLLKLILWTVTVVGWALTMTSVLDLQIFFTYWAVVLHWSQMIITLFMTIMKFVAMFMDTATDYAIS